ncbi:MAG: bifunctional phosphoserine phosphatase/homoserine phosphotransferase ThrH [Chloroflexota bacterium]
MAYQPTIVATDLEGVLIPEIWIAVAEKTGIADLRLTTRDIPDYDELMQKRLGILRDHQLSMNDIQAVIQTIDPFEGASDFLDWVRERTQCIILSDTFYEFAMPLMAKLGHPTLFCHTLEVDTQQMITGYRIRKTDPKTHAVIAFKDLGFRVIAFGDSYNDTGMLREADKGMLFRAPDRVINEFPQYPALQEYAQLQDHIASYLA